MFFRIVQTGVESELRFEGVRQEPDSRCLFPTAQLHSLLCSEKFPLPSFHPF